MSVYGIILLLLVEFVQGSEFISVKTETLIFYYLSTVGIFIYLFLFSF